MNDLVLDQTGFEHQKFSKWAQYIVPSIFPGRQLMFRFPNGYRVSVINDGYGSEHSLYEAAVMTEEGFARDFFEDDVVKGWLTLEDVLNILDRAFFSDPIVKEIS